MTVVPHAAWKPTPEQEADVRAANAAGETLTSIARRLGISKSPLSLWARAEGLTWERSGQTAAAAQTRAARSEEIRADLGLRYAEAAVTYLDMIEQPCVATFAGKEYQLSKPLPSDRRAFAQMSISFWKASQDIADHQAAANVDRSKSLLGDVAEALGIDLTLPAAE